MEVPPAREAVDAMVDNGEEESGRLDEGLLILLTITSMDWSSLEAMQSKDSVGSLSREEAECGMRRGMNTVTQLPQHEDGDEANSSALTRSRCQERMKQCHAVMGLISSLTPANQYQVRRGQPWNGESQPTGWTSESLNATTISGG